MKPVLTSIVLALTAASLAMPAEAQRRGDQYQAFQARKSGQVLSLREIEDRVLPRMAGANYLGPEYDDGVYRLRLCAADR